MGIFVFVKLDLRIHSGNSCIGISVFVNLDLKIRSGNLPCNSVTEESPSTLSCCKGVL